MKRILLFAFSFVFLLSFSVTAQERNVTGTVTSADDGSPLPGVSVIIKGTGTGTVTNIDGEYNLAVSSGDNVLVFSFVGMQTMERKIGSSSVIDVALSTDLTELAEVVVTGAAPGITTKTLGYSVSKVDEELIQAAPGVDPAQALQGKVAGVRIVQNGAPGSNAGIRLRGTTSLFTGQQPLVIVDGVIVDGGLSQINAEDIESFEVLKGSSAAAIYGSRGANGVIVINTRRGAGIKGEGIQVVVRNEVGRNFLPGRIDLANTHPYLVPDGELDHPIGNRTLDTDQLMDNPYVFGDDPSAPLPDYQDLVFKDQPFSTNYVSVTGKNEKSNFMISAQNTNQPGVVNGIEGQDRLNFKANMDYYLSEKFSISSSNFYSQTTIDNVVGGAFFDILLFRPDLDFFEEVPNPDDPNQMVINAKPDSSQQMVNPFYIFNNRSSTTTRNRYINSIGVNFSPFNWLTFEGFIGLDRQLADTKSIIPKGYLADDVGFAYIREGGITFAQGKSTAITSRANVVFNKSFGDLSISSRLGYWYESRRSENFSQSGTGLTVTDIYTFDNISNPFPPGSSSSEINSENGLLQVGMVYQDKLSLDLLYRQDAVSLFGEDSRTYGNYRVAASYRITEDFTIPQVQELKVRGSRATSGVWPGFSAQYEIATINAGNINKVQGGNSMLTPANSIEMEFGINARFLNMFDIDVSYVNNRTENQIISVPLPKAAGFARQWQNAGALEFSGIEVTLGANIVNNDQLRWNAGLVFDRYRQSIVELPIPEFRRGTGIQQSDVFLIKEGEPLGAIYSTRWMRSLEEVLVGDPEANLEDYAINSDGFVVRASDIGTINEVPLPYVDEEGATIHKTGDTNANFNVGLNNTITWKGLTLYFLFDWKQGGDIYSQTLQFLTRDNRAGFMDQTGATNPKPIGYYQAFYNTNNPSSFFVFDGSYVKLRELSLKYNLKGETIGIGNVIKNIQLGVVGRNLFMITKYPGYDPEVGQGGGNLDRTTYAVDGFGYPNFRAITGQIQLTF